MPSMDPVSEICLRWEEARLRGEALTPEQLCIDNPELLEPVREQIRILESMAGIIGVGQPSTGRSMRDSTGPESTTAERSAPPQLSGTRYDRPEFHARGGLGEVFIAYDVELQRQVALKLPQRRLANDPRNRERFLREAAITGRLEHPGIVPVYSLLHDQEGRPFYTMRFIEGDSLQEALRRYHREAHANWLDFRKLLNRFVAVCNTIAYAHSRQVIHRDLKPGNIMLGPYGETLVVDWGLARIIHTEAEESPVGSATTLSMESADSTQGMLGTLMFMSPEQARDSHTVGPAADIFSLGATLYTILTGEAPYQRCAPAELVMRVQAGEFPKPREIQPKLSRALEAVCLKAMAHPPEARYASALDLARDVERWLADEPVTAYREPFRKRLRRWTRRHRTVVTAGVVFLCMAIGVQQVRVNLLEQKNQEVEAEVNRTREARELASSQRNIALQILRDNSRSIAINAPDKVGTTTLRLNLMKNTERGLDQLTELNTSADPIIIVTRIAIHNQLGFTYMGFDPVRTREARAEYEKAYALAKDFPLNDERAAEVLSEKSICITQLFVIALGYGDLVDSKRQLDRFGELVKEYQQVSPESRETELAQIDYLFHQAMMGINRAEWNEVILKLHREAFQRSQKLFLQYPQDELVLSKLNQSFDALARQLSAMGNYVEARSLVEKQLTQMKAIYQQSPGPNHPYLMFQIGNIYRTLGEIMMMQGDTTAAIQQFSLGGDFLWKAEGKMPSNIFIRVCLADLFRNNAYALWMEGRSNDAHRMAVEGANRYRPLMATDPKNRTFAVNLVGCWLVGVNVFLQQGNAPFAIQTAQQINELTGGLFREQSDDPLVRLEYANSFFCVGLSEQLGGSKPKALAAYDKAREILEPIKDHPRLHDYNRYQSLFWAVEVKRHSLLSEVDATVRAADKLMETADSGWFAPFYAACGYAMAYAKLPEDAVEKRQQYKDRVIEHLKESSRLGMRNVEFIRRVPDLAALREDPALTSFLDDLARRKAPTFTLPKKDG